MALRVIIKKKLSFVVLTTKYLPCVLVVGNFFTNNYKGCPERLLIGLLVPEKTSNGDFIDN